MRLFIKSFHESSHKEWNVFMWVLDTLYSLLGNWLRDHTSRASSKIGVKIKSLSKNFWYLVLNFTAPRYAFLFSNFEIYVAHVIIFLWSRSVFFFPLRISIFPTDTLAKEASANQPMDEFDEVQYIPSIDLLEVLQVQNEGNWMTPIISYLKDRSLPEGKDEARKLRVRCQICPSKWCTI